MFEADASKVPEFFQCARGCSKAEGICERLIKLQQPTMGRVLSHESIYSAMFG